MDSNHNLIDQFLFDLILKIISFIFRSLKGNFGQRAPKVSFVRAKRREMKNQKPNKTGLEEIDYQKVENGSPEIKKVFLFYVFP